MTLHPSVISRLLDAEEAILKGAARLERQDKSGSLRAIRQATWDHMWAQYGRQHEHGYECTQVGFCASLGRLGVSYRRVKAWWRLTRGIAPSQATGLARVEFLVALQAGAYPELLEAEGAE